MEDLAWVWVEEQFALLQDGLRLLLLSWGSIVPAWWSFLRENSQALNHLALIAIGAIGLPLLWIRTRAADRQARAANDQARTAEQGHITDRFTKAVEQLGSEKMAVRLGAIYALERLSKDSREDHWTIMEVLTAYVREKATAPWALATERGEAALLAASSRLEGKNPDAQQIWTELAQKEEPRPKLRADVDIQAILTVLGRRSEDARRRELEEGRRLDLAVTDLRGAFLHEAHLENASLGGADLKRASFHNAHLDNAKLHQAILTEATFLTQAQLNSALGNEHTILPEGLTPPPHWRNPGASPATPPPSPPSPPEPRTDNADQATR